MSCHWTVLSSPRLSSSFFLFSKNPSFPLVHMLLTYVKTLVLLFCAAVLSFGMFVLAGTSHLVFAFLPRSNLNLKAVFLHLFVWCYVHLFYCIVPFCVCIGIVHAVVTPPTPPFSLASFHLHGLCVTLLAWMD